MAEWHWKYKFSYQKNLIRAKSLRKTNGTVPADRLYDVETTEKSATISGHMLTRAEMLAECAKVDSGAEVTYTLADGETVTGHPYGISVDNQEGTERHDVDVTLIVTGISA